MQRDLASLETQGSLFDLSALPDQRNRALVRKKILMDTGGESKTIAPQSERPATPIDTVDT